MQRYRRLTTEKVESELVELVVTYASNHNLTITNIQEAIEEVIKHMKDYAVLMEGNSFGAASPVSTL